MSRPSTPQHSAATEGPTPARVCHIVSTYHPVVGGTQSATRRICSALRAKGTPVTVLTRRLPNTPRFERLDGVPVHRAGLPLPGKVGALAFTAHAFLLLATRLRRQRVLHVQNIDAPLLLGCAARVLLRRRLVETIHTGWLIRKKRRTWTGRRRLALMTRQVEDFTAVAPSVARALEAVGVPPSRIRVIPNGIELDRFRPPTAAEALAARSAAAVDPEATVVLFVGRMVPSKDIGLLLEAWTRIVTPGRELHLVGDGPEMPRLRRLAAARGLAGVRFLGATEDVRPALWAADVFVLPSRLEGLSVSLLEARAVGLPVLVADIEANRDVVSDGEDGLTFESGSVESLAEALGRLLDSAELRKALGSAGQRSARARYGLDAAAAAHERFYGHILAGVRLRPSSLPSGR